MLGADIHGRKAKVKKSGLQRYLIRVLLQQLGGINLLFVALRSCSDHEPIQVNMFNTYISKKLFHFKFKNTWLKDPNFHKEVSEHWSTIHPVHLLPKLLNMSRFMVKWEGGFLINLGRKLNNRKMLLLG